MERDRQFPEKFKFGWSQAGFQSEMGSKDSSDPNSDWWVWVHDKDIISSGLVSGDFPEDGPNYWHNYTKFHDIAENMGLKLARIGIEWSRIFPKEWPEGLIDTVKRELPSLKNDTYEKIKKLSNRDALENYKKILEDLKKHGIEVIINLYHWPIPTWMSDPIKVHKGVDTTKSGWLNGDIVPIFAAYANFIANEIGEYASSFSTMNEPNVVYGNGMLNIKSGFPPSYYSEEYAKKSMENILKAHSLAYDTIKTRTDKMVGIIYANTSFTKASPEVSDKILDKAYYDSKWSFFDPLVKGSKELGITGKKLDWIGINYYTRTVIDKKGDGYKAVPGFGHAGERNSVTEDRRPTSDFGWEFYPDGLEENIMLYWKRYSLPLYVTENGIADEGDFQRPYYIVSHIARVHEAIRKGADVRGYLYWSLVDNYEWSSGFSQKFGLIGFDRKTKEFEIRPSALLYSDIARSNAIKSEFEHLNSTPPLKGLHH
ncbi:MAG: beta-galactosidase BgaS [Thermoplasmatales archaeon]